MALVTGRNLVARWDAVNARPVRSSRGDSRRAVRVGPALPARRHAACEWQLRFRALVNKFTIPAELDASDVHSGHLNLVVGSYDFGGFKQMRFNALALVASAIVLGACGGGGEAGTTDTATAAGATPAGGTAAAGGAAGTATAMPATGAMHEVKMVLEGNSYRFVPSEINAKVGDGIRFVMESGGPHNFGFDPANIPDDVEAQIRANMPPGSTELESPYVNTPGEVQTFSLAGVKPGDYPFHCQPHLALGMTGKISVK